jgi:hypothetical protein
VSTTRPLLVQLVLRSAGNAGEVTYGAKGDFRVREVRSERAPWRPLPVQIKSFEERQNFAIGNTRRRYPQAQELLTLMTGTTRLRVVGTARPATVEA